MQLFFFFFPPHLSASVCVRACACARWNQLDLAIVLLSVMGITLEEIEINAALPINPTIIRIMRVLRIARGTHAYTPTHIHLHTPTCGAEAPRLHKLQ